MGPPGKTDALEAGKLRFAGAMQAVAAAGEPGSGERSSSATTRAPVTAGSVMVSDRPLWE